MKTFFVASLVATVTLVGCASKNMVVATNSTTKTHPEWIEAGTIYELNTRQLTALGTFNAATDELRRIRDLGVDVVWMMPVQPIGKLERKGSLGSYYAIADYTGFNPEFGTRADFKNLVFTAHELGMRVILDWVANHTSPDHVWTANKGWHKRDSLGAMKVMYDWTDISELDYNNSQMRLAMQKAIEFWVDSIGVDGFRCDMAMLVPVDFWEETVTKIQSKNGTIFMLAEAEEPALMNAFDSYYGWELHHIMNALAQSKITADSLTRYFARAAERFPQGALRLNFTSNHDENSWQGSEFERMGAATQAMAALTYMVPGVPLIYNGQETGNTRRLRFFEKDTIERVVGAPGALFYRSMNAMREVHPAMHASTPMTIIETTHPKKVFALERKVTNDRMVGVFNFSPDFVDVELQGVQGSLHQMPTGIQANLTHKMLMQPWEYRIFYE